jgi:hypothetical protein
MSLCSAVDYQGFLWFLFIHFLKTFASAAPDMPCAHLGPVSGHSDLVAKLLAVPLH